MIETTYRIANAPRIALLTDIHGRSCEKIIISLKSHKPDLIAISGDLLYGSPPEDDSSPLDAQTNVLPFLDACVAIAPAYFSLGNHEWCLNRSDLKRISDLGVHVLDNNWEIINDSLAIGGLTSGHIMKFRRYMANTKISERDFLRYPERYIDKRNNSFWRELEDTPDTSWLTHFASLPGYRLLLSHHPEIFDLIPPSVNLVLSGHTHNGQIAYYSILRHRWTGLWAPGQGLFPKYSKGLYENDRLIVSAGLSNTAKIPRLFNPTEIVYIEPG